MGGTLRASRRIGKGLAKYLICSGNVLSAGDAEKIGLIDHEISIDDMCELLVGNLSLNSFTKKYQKQFNGKFSVIEKLFNNYTVDNIISGNITGDEIPVEIKVEIQKRLGQEHP